MSPIIKKQKSSGTVLFRFPKESAILQNINNKPLKDFQVIKPGIGEKILCVQRRHHIAIVSSLLQHIFLFICLLIGLFFISRFLRNNFPINIEGWIIITYLTLSLISLFSVSLIFIFMNWYYEFYIITNRSILHRNCFRLAGPYSDIVYIDKMHMREITRVPQNILYDFLKIEDVHLYFQKQEQEEPFIFRTPADAQVIEDLVHDLTIITERERHRKYD